jgi:hypothetical protein
LASAAFLVACPVSPPTLAEVECEIDGECDDGVCIDGRCEAGGPPPPVEDAGAPDDGGFVKPVKDAGGGEDVAPPIEAGPPALDAGPDAAVGDPCLDWAVPGATTRVRLTLTSVAQRSLPAGYLMKLHVDTSALPADLELIYCDGDGDVEARPFAVQAESALGVSDTVLVTRAAAEVPATGDDGYFLYGAPSTAGQGDVPAFRVRDFFVEGPTTSDRTFDLPGTTGPERWLVLISWQQFDSNGSLQSEADNGKASVRVDGQIVDNLEDIGHAQDPGSPRSHGAWLVLSPDPAGREVRLNFDSDDAFDQDSFRDIHVVAALLPDGAEVVRAVQTDVTANGDDVNVAEVSLPAGSGTWLWVANAVFRTDGMSVDAAIGGSVRQRVVDSEPGAGARTALMHAEIVRATSALALQLLSSSDVDATVHSARHLAINLNLFDTPLSESQTDLVVFAQNGFRDHEILSVPGATQPRDHLLFSSGQIDHSEGSNTISEVRVELVEDQAVLDEATDEVNTDRDNAERSHIWVSSRTTAVGFDVKQSVRNDDSIETEFGRSHLSALRYLDVETSAGARESAPGLDGGQ